ncbi:hypothetical protein [Pseudovibrio denitrificans]|uniref:hypothetical protein n=1 Tax=Pseudovibrio denitrificans TaxID=258256 RepID=UPI000FFBDD6D|nr:hypothetical protein [Pseudovibrio denitrificans]
MADNAQMINAAWVVRISERLTLSIVIIVLAITIIVAFWRSTQKINVSTQFKEVPFAASILLGTPVFIMIILVGYSYIVLSSPLETNATQKVEQVTNVPKVDGVSHNVNGRFYSSQELLQARKLSAAISSIEALANANLLNIPIAINQKEFDRALDVLKDQRVFYVVASNGVSSVKLWREKGENFLLNPSSFGGEEYVKLKNVSEWYRRIGEH